MSAKTYDRFVMVDAIDGAGKGAIADALSEWAASHQLQPWDLATYKQEMPTWDKAKQLVNGIDVLMVREPTYQGMGRIIREELIKDNKRPYDAKTIAHAFAIDRFILYQKLVIPALEEGVFVFSDRGVTTSQVYQPIDAKKEGFDEEYFLEFVRKIPGNEYTINHSPGLLIIAQVDAEEAMRRLDARQEQDDAVFENLEFQKQIADVYKGNRIKGFYEQRGTSVEDLIQLPGEGPEDTKRKAKEIWSRYRKEKGITL